MMSILGGREEQRGLSAASDVLIDSPVLHLVAVGESFRMSPRSIGKAGHILQETGCSSLENLVGSVATSDEDFIRLLKVPAGASTSAINSKGQAAFPSGSDLRD